MSLKVETGDPRDRVREFFGKAEPVSGFAISCAALGGACGFLIAMLTLERVEPIILKAINWVYDQPEGGALDAEALADTIGLGLGDADAVRAFAEILCAALGWIAQSASREESLVAIPRVLRQLTPS
jgi:hypothetical protein